MKGINNVLRNKVTALGAALVCMLSALPSTAFAAESNVNEPVVANTDVVASPYAGEEDLYFGNNDIGGFTFTDTNTTKTKTVVGGSKIYIDLGCKVPSTDAGLGNVKLTYRVMDENYNFITKPFELEVDKGGGNCGTNSGLIDLGYTGRKIHIWFDASSAGPSNGHFRSVNVYSFQIFVM